jgi:hypothetical protein
VELVTYPFLGAIAVFIFGAEFAGKQHQRAHTYTVRV